ncbi:hypothetical protein [Fibrella forsythiae]|uniref:Lipocalin-like domain-containing protein n=1 Tax=Fibrella forsythiae TaxID=2817061 RepID=A0ABS3JFH7_9BACT|nr:hypothetical protein [Fibrella forsythiae]MBO0948756.1 hypothetical protein [Fibrella forsythiae]
MKTLASLLLFGVLLTGCKSSNDAVTPATTTNFPDIVAPGTWTISSFMQGTEDKLKTLGSIKITFSSDGKAIATLDNSQSTSGNWSWGGNSYYGTPADSKTVTLNFGTSKPYDKLSKTWTIINVSSSVISLDNANPAENEHLKLSK